MKGVTNDIVKKANRGSYSVKHYKNSGTNYITIMDSKPVSILSTAAGVLHPYYQWKDTPKNCIVKWNYHFPMRSQFITSIWEELTCTTITAVF